MRKAVKIIPIVVGLLIFFSPISAKNSTTTYSCDTCHKHANLYLSHLEGGKYCARCHGEIHELHTFSCETCHVKKPLTILCHAAPSDVQILTPPPEKNAVCENCHINIVEVHNSDCQSCHVEDVNKIHAKANLR
ncbi:MAG: hypothetical protein QW763_00425 [Archaeoglobaceae archaeon]